VLDDILIRVISRTAPGRLPGRNLHRRALAAAAAGRYADAEQLFEAAVQSYRRTLDVEALARLRVHQQMVHARAGCDPVREAELMLGIVRSLNKLDRLEALAAPYELVDARAVLSTWLAEAPQLALPEADGAHAVAAAA
jgi:hypothetical protein